MSRHHYAVFGLRLASDFHFEVLAPAAPAPGEDVLQVRRTRGLRPVAPFPVDPHFDIRPGRQVMNWNAVGAFSIEDDRTVLIDPVEGVSDHLVSQAFLGLVMSLVLERRGILCLHASAVSIDGRAAIFLGDKGAGKSTTCATLLARGHVPVTDDLVAVEGAGEGVPLVRPGFDSMKLWPDTVEALALGEDAADRLIHPSVSKVQKRMRTPMAPAPVPMGGLFVLRRDAGVAAPAVRRLPPHEALQMVLRYTFMARYGETRLGRDHLAGHMRRCAAVVAAVPVYDLMVPADLTRLADLAETIEGAFEPGRAEMR